MRKIAIFCCLLLLLSTNAVLSQQLSFIPQKSPTKASLRGLFVLNDSVAFASGAKGTLLRTQDAGKNWQLLPAPDSLDFRTLWVLNEQEALIASAGQPARIYRTADAGQTWQLVYADSTGKGFFDAISFWDKQHGWALSDPIDGKMMLLETADGGNSWKPLQAPAPVEGEAYFAASNGSIAMMGQQKAWIGTGGGAIRILSTQNRGKSWKTQVLDMPKYSEAAGIYALSFNNVKDGVAVGGAYDKPEDGKHAAHYTTDGGKKWHLSQGSPSGYRSGMAWLPNSKTVVSVGTKGTDISRDGGKNWQQINTENLNSIRFSPSGKKGWAIGGNGTIFMIEVNP